MSNDCKKDRGDAGPRGRLMKESLRTWMCFGCSARAFHTADSRDLDKVKMLEGCGRMIGLDIEEKKERKRGVVRLDL